MGVGAQYCAPAALLLENKPGSHCTRRQTGPKPGKDRCGKPRLNLGLKAEPSSL